MFDMIGVGIGIDAVSEIGYVAFGAEDIQHLFGQFVQVLFGGVQRARIEIALKSDRGIFLSESSDLSSRDGPIQTDDIERR